MFKRLGPIDLAGDCPPYVIVQASRRIGIDFPEDVGWCRLREFLNQPPSWRELLSLRSWKVLLGWDPPGPKRCLCGRKLPALEQYAFTFNTGREIAYLLGQCRRCRTVFWEDAP